MTKDLMDYERFREHPEISSEHFAIYMEVKRQLYPEGGDAAIGKKRRGRKPKAKEGQQQSDSSAGRPSPAGQESLGLAGKPDERKGT